MWLGFLAFRAVVRWLPWSVAQMAGRLLGYLAYAVLPRYRRLTFEHLRFALGPRASLDTQRRIARGVFVNLGQSFMEWQVVDRLSPERIRGLVDVHGAHHLREAIAQGRGVIALSAHFGNWELLAIAISCLGFRGSNLARRLRYPEYEQFLRSMRLHKGIPTLARDSVKDIVHALRDNQIIGMMPDQDMDSLDGVFVDFFGHPAYTPVGPAALSLMTGAPIVPCFIIRDGRRFRVEIEEPITLPHRGDRAQDLLQMTETWTRVVESYIRRHPTQWVWMHRRWKTQPSTKQQAASNKQQTTSTQHQAGNRQHAPQAFPLTACCLLLLAYCLVLTVPQGCAKPRQPASAASTEPPAPQQMDTFTMTGYTPEGTKRWELEGIGAVAEGDVVTVRRPNAIGYDVARTSYLSASLAHVNQTTRDIRLEHDVVVHTSDGLWLFSPELFWLSARSEVVTDQPVRLETDHMLLRGRGATANDQLKTAVIERDVELVLNPTEEHDAGTPVSHATITCDGPLTFEYVKGIATFEQNVHVNDAQGDLYSDRLIAYMNQATRVMTYAEAFGRVRIVQGPNTAAGDHAVYEPATAKITLLGTPSLLVHPDGTTATPLAVQTAASP